MAQQQFLAVFTSAPEIDPSIMGGAATLLIGALAVRGRRSREAV